MSFSVEWKNVMIVIWCCPISVKMRVSENNKNFIIQSTKVSQFSFYTFCF
uniref:Uncharacterized protein n=1 Tax=Anguilla anguilla TaxID=7936 RepID=A0A0E9XHI7_ANGAN